jgi:very-short-patch-repair endonuclease
MRDNGVEHRRDAAIARIAARQHGVVAARQLYAAGLTREAVRRRASAGRLHRVFRGVYAVGHAGLSNEGRWMAAVLACGEGAALSHRSAAELWGMLDPVAGPVHVTVSGAGGRKRRAGIHLHRSPDLTNTDTTRRYGIAVTTPARTLRDLRRTVSPKLVRRAIRQAEFDRLPIGGHAGETAGTRSDLEHRFLRLCRRYRLPEPEVNVKVGRFTVDFLWRQEGLVVETDSYRTHRGRQAFIDDRERDNELAARGLDVLRFTDVRIDNEPSAVAALIRQRLNERSLARLSRYA